MNSPTPIFYVHNPYASQEAFITLGRSLLKFATRVPVVNIPGLHGKHLCVDFVPLRTRNWRMAIIK